MEGTTTVVHCRTGAAVKPEIEYVYIYNYGGLSKSWEGPNDNREYTPK